MFSGKHLPFFIFLFGHWALAEKPYRIEVLSPSLQYKIEFPRTNSDDTSHFRCVLGRNDFKAINGGPFERFFKTEMVFTDQQMNGAFFVTNQLTLSKSSSSIYKVAGGYLYHLKGPSKMIYAIFGYGINISVFEKIMGQLSYPNCEDHPKTASFNPSFWLPIAWADGVAQVNGSADVAAVRSGGDADSIVEEEVRSLMDPEKWKRSFLGCGEGLWNLYSTWIGKPFVNIVHQAMDPEKAWQETVYDWSHFSTVIKPMMTDFVKESAKSIKNFGSWSLEAKAGLWCQIGVPTVIGKYVPKMAPNAAEAMRVALKDVEKGKARKPKLPKFGEEESPAEGYPEGWKMVSVRTPDGNVSFVTDATNSHVYNIVTNNPTKSAEIIADRMRSAIPDGLVSTFKKSLVGVLNRSGGSNVSIFRGGYPSNPVFSIGMDLLPKGATGTIQRMKEVAGSEGAGAVRLDRIDVQVSADAVNVIVGDAGAIQTGQTFNVTSSASHGYSLTIGNSNGIPVFDPGLYKYSNFFGATAHDQASNLLGTAIDVSKQMYPGETPFIRFDNQLMRYDGTNWVQIH